MKRFDYISENKLVFEKKDKKIFEIGLDIITQSTNIIDYKNEMSDGHYPITQYTMDNGLIIYCCEFESYFSIFKDEEEFEKSLIGEESIMFHMDLKDTAKENKEDYLFYKQDELTSFLDEISCEVEDIQAILANYSKNIETHTEESDFSTYYTAELDNGLIAHLSEDGIQFYKSMEDFKIMTTGEDNYTSYDSLDIESRQTPYTIVKGLKKAIKYDSNKIEKKKKLNNKQG